MSTVRELPSAAVDRFAQVVDRHLVLLDAENRDAVDVAALQGAMSYLVVEADDGTLTAEMHARPDRGPVVEFVIAAADIGVHLVGGELVVLDGGSFL